jgi:hypothetical protein
VAARYFVWMQMDPVRPRNKQVSVKDTGGAETLYLDKINAMKRNRNEHNCQSPMDLENGLEPATIGFPLQC